jgi:hypothetical protein
MVINDLARIDRVCSRPDAEGVVSTLAVRVLAE